MLSCLHSCILCHGYGRGWSRSPNIDLQLLRGIITPMAARMRQRHGKSSPAFSWISQSVGQWLQCEKNWLPLTLIRWSHSIVHQQKRCSYYPTCRQMDKHHIHGLHSWSVGCNHLWSCTSHVNTNTILQHGMMIPKKNEWLIVTHLQSKIPRLKPELQSANTKEMLSRLP